jgi:hypothetical protein
LGIRRGVVVKRDMDLIRELLVYLEEKPNDRHVEITLDGHDAFTIGYHLVLLYEAGLIAGEPSVTSTGRVIKVLPFRLTWEGHEFLSTARDVSVWRKTKAKAMASAGDIPLSVLKELLLQTLRTHLGIPGGS